MSDSRSGAAGLLKDRLVVVTGAGQGSDAPSPSASLPPGRGSS